MRIWFDSLRILRGKPLLNGLSRIFHHGRTTEQQNQVVELFLILKDHSLDPLIDQKKYCIGKDCDLYKDMEDTSAWSSD